MKCVKYHLYEWERFMEQQAISDTHDEINQITMQFSLIMVKVV